MIWSFIISYCLTDLQNNIFCFYLHLTQHPNFFYFIKFVLQSREKLRLTHSSYLHEINKIRVKIQIIALHYSPNVHPSKPLITTRTWFEFPLPLPSRKLSLFLSPAFLFFCGTSNFHTSSKYKWIERDKLILFFKKKKSILCGEQQWDAIMHELLLL